MGAAEIRAGRAYVELTTHDNTGPGLRSSQAQLRAYATSLKTIGMGMMTAGAALLAPLIASTKTFMDMGHGIAEMSKRTGVGVETLSALGYAAKQNGVEMDGLGMGLKKMATHIYDARNGLGAATKDFNALGLSVGDLAKLSPEEQFKAIAQAMSRISDPTEKAALAVKVFGRNGVELIPLLDQGAAGIDRLTRHARDMGIVLSKEDVAAADEFHATFVDVVEVVKMAMFQLGAALAPALKDIARIVIRVSATLRDFIRDHQALATAALALGTALVGLGATLYVLGSVAKGIAAIQTACTLATTAAVGMNAALAATPAAGAVGGVVSRAGETAAGIGGGVVAGKAVQAVWAKAADYASHEAYAKDLAAARIEDTAAAGLGVYTIKAIAARAATVSLVAAYAALVVTAGYVGKALGELRIAKDEAQESETETANLLAWNRMTAEEKARSGMYRGGGRVGVPGEALSYGPRLIEEQRAQKKEEAAKTFGPPKPTEEQFELAYKLRKLRIEGEEDVLAKKLDAINNEYDEEIRKLKDIGASKEKLDGMEEARRIELDNAAAEAQRKTDKETDDIRRGLAEKSAAAEQQDEAEQLAKNTALFEASERAYFAAKEANKSRLETVEELTLRKNLKGVELEKALLDLEEQRARERARAAGENLDIVGKEFDLRRQLLDVPKMEMVTRGIFNINQLQSLQTSLASDRLVNAADRGASASERAAKAMEDLKNWAEENGLAFS